MGVSPADTKLFFIIFACLSSGLRRFGCCRREPKIHVRGRGEDRIPAQTVTVSLAFTISFLNHPYIANFQSLNFFLGSTLTPFETGNFVGSQCFIHKNLAYVQTEQDLPL